MLKNEIADSKKVIPVTNPLKRKTPTLKELLKEDEIADFFRFVHLNGLRVKALELIEERLNRREL